MPSKSGLIPILIVSLYVAVYKSPKRPTAFYFICIATYFSIDYHFFFDCLIGWPVITIFLGKVKVAGRF